MEKFLICGYGLIRCAYLFIAPKIVFVEVWPTAPGGTGETKKRENKSKTQFTVKMNACIDKWRAKRRMCVCAVLMGE